MLIDLFLYLYVVVVICMAGLVWTIWELLEAKANGKKWYQINRELEGRIAALENKKR